MIRFRFNNIAWSYYLPTEMVEKIQARIKKEESISKEIQSFSLSRMLREISDNNVSYYLKEIKLHDQIIFFPAWYGESPKAVLFLEAKATIIRSSKTGIIYLGAIALPVYEFPDEERKRLSGKIIEDIFLRSDVSGKLYYVDYCDKIDLPSKGYPAKDWTRIKSEYKEANKEFTQRSMAKDYYDSIRDEDENGRPLGYGDWDDTSDMDAWHDEFGYPDDY